MVIRACKIGTGRSCAAKRHDDGPAAALQPRPHPRQHLPPPRRKRPLRRDRPSPWRRSRPSLGQQQQQGISLPIGPLVRQDQERRLYERSGCDRSRQSCRPWKSLRQIRDGLAKDDTLSSIDLGSRGTGTPVAGVRGTITTQARHSMKLGMLICTIGCLALGGWPCPPPPQNVWTGKGQAGYTSSSGNSEGKSANAAIDMAYLDDPWKHAFHLGGLYGQSAGIVSAERWDTSWQTNYNLTANLYTFGLLRLPARHVQRLSTIRRAPRRAWATRSSLPRRPIGCAGWASATKCLRPEDYLKFPTASVSRRTLLTVGKRRSGDGGDQLLPSA